MVLDVLEWRDSVRTFLDKYQLVEQKESEELVESKYEVKVQEIEEKARDDVNVGYADVTCDELLEEPDMIIDDCSIVALVCDQPSNEILVPVKTRSSSTL